ncbi:MAG TPA: hypothetical protein VFF67_05625 [Thermoplasmata archaeon]|nr:hypothetical protein [Thermoplasmata archaeon]
MGKAGSPVLDKYPPRPDPFARGAPPAPPPAKPPRSVPAASPPAPTPAATAPPPAPAPAPLSLIALERPFSVDEFAALLGSNRIRVVVPKEDLAEALQRISDFMGFGIYVYEFVVRPAPEDQLKKFVVELTRVDFSAARGDWLPFQDKGRSESPFGPDAKR